MICFAYPVGLSLGSGSLLSWPVFVVALLGLYGGSAAQRFTSVFVWVRAAPAPREEMMAAMALGALVLGVPHFEESTTPSLAPKTGEAPAQQPQPPQPPQQQADEGHHPPTRLPAYPPTRLPACPPARPCPPTRTPARHPRHPAQVPPRRPPTSHRSTCSTKAFFHSSAFDAGIRPRDYPRV